MDSAAKKTLAKNKDGLYVILKRRVSNPFSSNLKNGGFCSRITNEDVTPNDPQGILKLFQKWAPWSSSFRPFPNPNGKLGTHVQ